VGGVGQKPTRSALFQNAPNPFRQLTAISYQLSAPSHTSLKIYDLSGRLVRTLVDGEKEAGYYTANWDRKDFRGRELSNGVYFYRLVSGEYAETRKMVLLK
jgi:flagellar hook assembly protein FlgD